MRSLDPAVAGGTARPRQRVAAGSAGDRTRRLRRVAFDDQVQVERSLAAQHVAHGPADQVHRGEPVERPQDGVQPGQRPHALAQTRADDSRADYPLR